MKRTVIETPLFSSPQKCFDLARNAAFHVVSAKETGERIIKGKTSGLWELGDEITFEARHLGVRQRFSARIVAFEPPHFFTDEMTRGVFRFFRHTHRFTSQNDGSTLMRDEIEWVSPLGILGRVADAILVAPHLRRFITLRAARIKKELEK